MPASKILMITGDFTEDYETMVPFQTLLACGYTGPCRLPRQDCRPDGRHRHP